LSDLELFRYARPFLTTEQKRLMSEHMFITAVGSIPIGIVTGVAAALGHPGLAVRAIAGLGEVDSAAPVWSMWELSRLVAESAELTAAFDAGTGGVMARIRGLSAPAARGFLTAFDEFLDRFGSRCASEWDLGVLAWESDPGVPITAVDKMRRMPDSESPSVRHERLAADRAVASAEMLAAVAGDPAAVGQLQAGLRAAAVWLPARERSKTTVILQLHEAREALQELGRRMVACGVFDRMSDFTLLKLDEFEAFIADPESMTGEIRRRRRWHDELWKLDPPFNTVGLPEPSSHWRRRVVEDLPPVTVGEVISGIGACPGAATGRARIILDPDDGGRLEPGDVMIAPGTDPAWTPLFVSLAAVVVDVGAPLSHAAIVSRELGVPCVVSATHATRRIPDGAVVSVDGNTGAVTIVSVP
jgi:pyruvate,water dikinase